MKILVYGAGNIGSLFAAKLSATDEVSVLARGERLARIRGRGIDLENVRTGEKASVPVEAVGSLDPNDAYDLVLVVMAKDHVAEVLPILARNKKTPSVMFMGNNAAGPSELVDALGPDRVLLGFPGAAAIEQDGAFRYLVLSAREQPTTIGELDGTKSERIQAIAASLEAAGFPVSIASNIDAWLKTHATEISPTANALYMAGGDAHRLARTRDALVLMLRAIREGYRVLVARGIPITPANHRAFQWIPEPILLVIMKRMIESDETNIKIGHAQRARSEMKILAGDLRSLASGTSVSTPAMDRLYAYLDPSREPMPDGCSEITLHWRGVWGLVAAAAVSLLAVFWLVFS